jgi:hypothetical protein
MGELNFTVGMQRGGVIGVDFQPTHIYLMDGGVFDVISYTGFHGGW